MAMWPDVKAIVAAALDAERRGDRRQAIASWRRALAQQPDFADGWYELGRLLRAEGEAEEALQAYDSALRCNVAAPEEVRLNRAVIFSDLLRRPDAAQVELEAALKIRPDYAPALLNLGNLLEERGDAEAAKSCYRRLVPFRPGSPHADLQAEALARLAQIEPPASPDDPALAVLATTAAAPGLGDVTRANLLFAAGRAFDALGAYERAFDSYAAANRRAKMRARPYDRRATENLISVLIESTRRPTVAEEGASSWVKPVFICGMFRSGSTLAERVLGAHPQITPGDEIDFFPRLVAGPLSPFPASLARLAEEAALDSRAAYVAHLEQLFPLAPRGGYITDKRPDNFLLIGLIKRLFPDARIIHTVRAPLDNALSIFFQHLDPNAAPYACDLQDIGHYFGQYRRLAAHWEKLYADDIFVFDYDRFVAEPRTVLQGALAHLGLGWDDACLDFHARAGVVKTASYWQVRRPLYGDSSGRWRNYARQIGPLRDALLAAGLLDIPDTE